MDYISFKILTFNFNLWPKILNHFNWIIKKIQMYEPNKRISNIKY
jgi:hypothetical protein